MRKGLRLVPGLASALALGATVSAHHSFGATYEISKEIKLEGKLVQVVYRNPHSFVHIEAPDANGVKQRWAVEWGGTAQLSNQGVKRNSLSVGDELIITARPSRAPGEYRVLMVTLTRPSDGFGWGRSAGQVVE
jgi:hypothetical protein